MNTKELLIACSDVLLVILRQSKVNVIDLGVIAETRNKIMAHVDNMPVGIKWHKVTPDEPKPETSCIVLCTDKHIVLKMYYGLGDRDVYEWFHNDSPVRTSLIPLYYIPVKELEELDKE